VSVVTSSPFNSSIKINNLKKRTHKTAIQKPDIYVALVVSDMTIHRQIVDLLSAMNIQTITHTKGQSLIDSLMDSLTDGLMDSLNEQHPLQQTHCLIIETELDDMYGVSLFKKLLVICHGLPPTIMIGVRNASTVEAVDVMGLGAIDYIEKPFSSRQLIVSLNHALESRL
jgi:FixJ family two-component response regulator